MNIPIYTAITEGGFVAVGYFYIDKESAKPTIAGYLIFDDDNKVMPLYDNFRVLYDTLKPYKTVNLESAEAINFGCPTVDEILKSRNSLE